VDEKFAQAMELLRQSLEVDPYGQASNVDELLALAVAERTSPTFLEEICERSSVLDRPTLKKRTNVPDFSRTAIAEEFLRLLRELAGQRHARLRRKRKR
jgi:hypothetical protein